MKKLVYILLLAAVIFWGLSFVWTTRLLQADVPVATYVFARIFLAAVIMWIFCGFTGRLQKIAWRDVPILILIGFLHPFLYFTCENFGLKATESITLCALIGAMIPIFAMLASALILKTKIRLRDCLCALVIIPGVYLISYGELTPKYWWGILLMAGAVFASVSYNILAVKVSRYNVWTTVTSQFTVGSVFLFAMLLFQEGGVGTLAAFSSWATIGPLLALAVLCSVAAFIFYVLSLRTIGVARTAMFNTISPVVSSGAAFLLGLEGCTWTKILGFVIIIAAVIASQK